MTIAKVRIAIAGGAVAVAGVLAACGSTSGSGTTQSGSPSPPATSSAPAAGTGSLEQFRQVATGPLARAVQADAAKLSQDAANRPAAEADARQLAADLNTWAHALAAVPVPASAQASKDKVLQGLDRMRTGATEFADGLRNHDDALIKQGQQDVQAGVSIVTQAGSPAP